MPSLTGKTQLTGIKIFLWQQMDWPWVISLFCSSTFPEAEAPAGKLNRMHKFGLKHEVHMCQGYNVCQRANNGHCHSPQQYKAETNQHALMLHVHVSRGRILNFSIICQM